MSGNDTGQATGDADYPTPILSVEEGIFATCDEMGCSDRATWLIEDFDGDTDTLCSTHAVAALWAEIRTQRADLGAFVQAEQREPLRGFTITPRRRQQIERLLSR